MDNFVGEQITYVILQERPENQDGMTQRLPLIYDAGMGAFSSTSMIEYATNFQDEAEALELAELQNKISTLLRQNFNYIVIKNVISREIISGVVPEETEPENPVNPELEV